MEIYGYSRRSTNGRSRITAYYSERRTGIDSRRLVPKHFRLSLPPSYVSLADGNPDEKKIGAFGVGGSKDYSNYRVSYLRSTQASTACSR